MPPSSAQWRGRLLIVDDQPVNIRLLHQIFAADHDVFMATSGEQALAFCRETPPDLVLLDVVMDGMDGLEVCRQLKADERTRDIPVIFITGKNDTLDEIACLDAGGVDFINKPVNSKIVRARACAHLTLKRQADMLREMVFVDGLTGVANRRQFDERLATEWLRHQRNGQPLSLILIDVDYFKRYNDTYGHQAGDDCLRQVGAAIRQTLNRPSDLVARYGGEEFCCILPETDSRGALAIGHNIERAVRGLEIPHRASDIAQCVTISAGVATTRPSADKQLADLVEVADQMLYQAKREGRGRVGGH